MIDIHTHILPNLDDGAENVAVSLEMIEKEVEQGVRVIVATPHYYGKKHSPERFLERREDAFSNLKNALGERSIELRLGAEIYFTEDSVASNRSLAKLKIEGTKYVLLELPWSERWTDRLWVKLSAFIEETGLTPIIAHVERYAEIRKNPRWLALLADMGCVIQVNTGAFLEKETSSLAWAMLDKGLVHCLGTDTHNLGQRAPNYEKAKSAFLEKGKEKDFLRIQKNMETALNGGNFSVKPYESLKRFFKKYY